MVPLNSVKGEKLAHTGPTLVIMDLEKESFNIFLHQNIRCLRKRLNLSQEELANRVGLNRGNIASYENGTAEPKICNLLKLSSLFGITIMDLTQRDLSEEQNYLSATHYFQQLSNGERDLIHQFLAKAEEIEAVFRGLHTCCRFKANGMSDMPKDMQILLSNFDQLYEAAQTLLGEHKALIDFIRCRTSK